MAKQVISVYKRHRKERSAIALKYYETLPYTRRIDEDRGKTYDFFHKKLRAETESVDSAFDKQASTRNTPANRVRRVCRGQQ